MASRNILTKAKTYPPTSIHQTYSIAHTAQCKLSIAADAPDRNLRFLLGHAMTLDNALIRIVEIENTSSNEEPEQGDKSLGVDIEAGEAQADALSGGAKGGKSGSLAGGKVKFGNEKTIDPAKDAVPAEPDPVEDVDEDEEEDGMGLQRFASASAVPPRMVPSTEEDSDEEDDEPISPPTLPSDFDYNGLMQGEEDEELGKLYEEVRSCPCHGHGDVKAKKMWDVKTPEGQMGNRKLAVMEVQA